VDRNQEQPPRPRSFPHPLLFQLVSLSPSKLLHVLRGLVSMLLIVVLSSVAAGVCAGCISTSVVLRFRPPTADLSGSALGEGSGGNSISNGKPSVIPLVHASVRLANYSAREFEGVTRERLENELIGPPHERRATSGSGELWLYTFVRMPAGFQWRHDARLVGRFPSEFPNLRLAFSLFDNKVVNAQMAWFEQTPVLSFDVEKLLGPPDRRETTQQGERFHYRYECFTSARGSSGSTMYFITEAVVSIPFSAQGNTGGLDVLVADQSKIVVYPDGRTEDPSTGVSWTMRPNLLDPRASPTQVQTDLIATDVKRLGTPGLVQACFGWPTETLTNDALGLLQTCAVYPLTRKQSVPSRLIVTYLRNGMSTVVKSLGLHFNGGLPRDPADLRLRLGSPDRTVGAPAGGREDWVYEYRIAAAPPVSGTPMPLVLGLRVTFSVKNGVELQPGVKVERTSLALPPG